MVSKEGIIPGRGQIIEILGMRSTESSMEDDEVFQIPSVKRFSGLCHFTYLKTVGQTLFPALYRATGPISPQHSPTPHHAALFPQLPFASSPL